MGVGVYPDENREPTKQYPSSEDVPYPKVEIDPHKKSSVEDMQSLPWYVWVLMVLGFFVGILWQAFR